jgi:hypothetical protein
MEHQVRSGVAERGCIEIAGLHRGVAIAAGTAAAVQRVAAQLYSVYRQVCGRCQRADPVGQMMPGKVCAAQLSRLAPVSTDKDLAEFEGSESLDAVLCIDGHSQASACCHRLSSVNRPDGVADLICAN